MKKEILSKNKTVLFLFGFSILASITNYVFQIVLGNVLSFSDFGRFNTINALSTNFVSLYSPLAVYVCRTAVENQKGLINARIVYQKVFKFVLYVSIVVVFVGVLVFPSELGIKYDVEFILFEVLFIVMTVCGGIYVVINGILQGINRFGWYGFLGFALMAIRLIGLYIGILFGGGLLVPIWAMLISYIIVTGVIIIIIMNTIKSQKGSVKPNNSINLESKEIAQMYGITFLVQMLISLYINGGEIILMNYLYDSEGVGVYALIATIAKITMYVLSIFTSILLPIIAKEWTQGKNIKKKFYCSMICSFIMGVIWAIFLVTSGQEIIPRILGEKYYLALSNTKYMIPWIVGIGMLIVINTFYLAINRLKKYLIVLCVVTMLIVLTIMILEVDIWHVPVVAGIGVLGVVIFAVVDIGGLNSINGD